MCKLWYYTKAYNLHTVYKYQTTYKQGQIYKKNESTQK